ncbi:MAG: Type pilus biosis and competence protein PilQ precursor [Pseudomonadota bacterium]
MSPSRGLLVLVLAKGLSVRLFSRFGRFGRFGGVSGRPIPFRLLMNNLALAMFMAMPAAAQTSASPPSSPVGLTSSGPSPDQTSQPAAEGVLSDQPISLNFQNIDIKALLQVFADFSGANIVATDGVSGVVTVRLNQVPWRQALNIVLQSKGLVARQEGRVLWVSKPGEWELHEKRMHEAQSALEAVSPLAMLSLRLQYARATDVAQRLQGGAAGSVAGRWLSARGSVLAEPRTNQIFISDLPARLVDLEKMLTQLDVPVRQILIEARIVEADDQFGQSLGVRLGAGMAIPLKVQGSAQQLSVGTTNAATAAGTVSGNQVNLPAGLAGQTLNSPSTFAVSLFNAAADRFINVEISALEASGLGKVVSRPRVVTADQTKALIEQGTELPYQTSAGNGVTAISFRKANLKLEVTPQITPDGSVVLEVDVNRDSVGQITPAGYAINTKHVRTQVRVEDGGTVVLGGIYEETDRHDETKVPGLGELPGLGWLFRKRDQTRRKSELLIFLTPRVIADGRP